MTNDRVYNFSAGPSIMPESVLEKAKAELMNYGGSGTSVMEMSHRSRAFKEIFSETKERMRRVMNIPQSHEILFLQGGATLQFAAIPMNLMGTAGTADYAITGNFSGKAAKEAQKYGNVHVAFDGKPSSFRSIPSQSELNLSKDASYFYYCANNTIFGTEWNYVPETGCPIVCDMSSDILSRETDVSRFGLIYAGAQKNLAPAGLTVVILRKDLAGKQFPFTPQIMSYDELIAGDSMVNTPPCWCIYMLGLTLEWIESMGGVAAMRELREERSKIVYDYLDESRLFIPHADKQARSCMNVTFRTGSDELDAEFVREAEKKGLVNLKGHKLTGGLRASMYNAMPVEGAEELVKAMKEFERNHV